MHNSNFIKKVFSVSYFFPAKKLGQIGKNSNRPTFSWTLRQLKLVKKSHFIRQKHAYSLREMT